LAIVFTVRASLGMVNKLIPVAQKPCLLLSGVMALSQTVMNNVPNLQVLVSVYLVIPVKWHIFSPIRLLGLSTDLSIG
jgi:hypothetical protein